MEAATKPLDLRAAHRARRFERECERLRPLGEAYVLRRFGGRLSRADAEDAVSEVLIRLHRRNEEGRTPDNLRAVFFTSVRNAAIDQFRSRSARPTVGLEAALTTPGDSGIPADRAEGRDDAVRLKEALQRMRANYREAILLRYGLGLTVPEIAKQLEMSLPAAKKLVLRATRQVKERLIAIEGAEFCPEMQEIARSSLLEKQASGLASEAEAEVLRAHFAHCGSCRSFVAALHERLHDLGTATLLTVMAGDQSAASVGRLDWVADWLGGLGDSAHVAAEKGRQLALRLAGATPAGEGGAAGAVFGSAQKIAAICTAGAATTATCLLTGAVGPGIGNAPPIREAERTSPPITESLSRETATPESVAASPEPMASSPTTRSSKRRRRSNAAPSRAPQTTGSAAGEEFGFEPGPAQRNGRESGEVETVAPTAATPSVTSAGGGSDRAASGGDGLRQAAGSQGGVGFEG